QPAAIASSPGTTHMAWRRRARQLARTSAAAPLGAGAGLGPAPPARGRAPADLSAQLSDVGQLQAPGLGPGPADVPGPVKVGVVEVDQAAPPLAEAAKGPGGLVAEGVGAPGAGHSA